MISRSTNYIKVNSRSFKQFFVENVKDTIREVWFSQSMLNTKHHLIIHKRFYGCKRRLLHEIDNVVSIKCCPQYSLDGCVCVDVTVEPACRHDPSRCIHMLHVYGGCSRRSVITTDNWSLVIQYWLNLGQVMLMIN